MAEDLAELRSALRKVELKSDELEYLVEEISKESMKDAAWFFLLFIVRCEGKRQIEEGIAKQEMSQDSMIWKSSHLYR